MVVRRIPYGRNLDFLDRTSLEHSHKTLQVVCSAIAATPLLIFARRGSLSHDFTPHYHKVLTRPPSTISIVRIFISF
jgi:hypothetical protein